MKRNCRIKLKRNEIGNVIHLGGVTVRRSRAEAAVRSLEHGNGAIDRFSQFLSLSLFLKSDSDEEALPVHGGLLGDVFSDLLWRDPKDGS